LTGYGRPKIRRAEHAVVSARPVVAFNNKDLLHSLHIHSGQMAGTKSSLEIKATDRSVQIENLTRQK
jgi:hypothetical protein